MREIKKIEKILSQTATCNKCSKQYVQDEESVWSKNLWDSQIHLIRISFGYSSKYDGQMWNFDLCESCLEGLVSSFSIKPDIRNYL